jgi:hypothetical protein
MYGISYKIYFSPWIGLLLSRWSHTAQPALLPCALGGHNQNCCYYCCYFTVPRPARFAHVTGIVQITIANPPSQPCPLSPRACALKLKSRMSITFTIARSDPAALSLEGSVELDTTPPALAPARTCWRGLNVFVSAMMSADDQIIQVHYCLPMCHSWAAIRCAPAWW